MSFGRPGGFDAFKVLPPDRGSFPLDHDGECKAYMLSYLKCLKANSSDNGKCRAESKGYLECRMDKGLMTRDDFANLGLGDVGAEPHLSNPILPTATVTTSSPSPTTTTTTTTATTTTNAPVDPNTMPRI